MPKEEINVHKQLRNVVADRLRTAISNGEFAPGEWLRQERLAQDYGVSQMPVREALKELAAEGLVEHVPYRGVRVVEFSTDDIADLYTSRSFLEGMTAHSAALHIVPEEVAALRAIQAQMRLHLAPTQLEAFRELNRQFHQRVYTASRRAYLIRLLNQIWTAFPSMLWGNYTEIAQTHFPDRDLADLTEHEAIIDALEHRNAAAAEHLMRTHIQASGEGLVAALRAKAALHAQTVDTPLAAEPPH